MTSGFNVFCGLDVGKDTHHATGLTADGMRVHDAALSNTEAGLRTVFDQLAQHGSVLIVVDQPASIGALPVAVARDCGCSPWLIIHLADRTKIMTNGCVISVHDPDQEAALGDLTRFRLEFYRGLTAQADALFELTGAVLCTDGAVRSLVGLSLAPEHRRGHGALYDGINHGRLDIGDCGIWLPHNGYRKQRTAGSRSPWTSRPGCVPTPTPRRIGRSVIRMGAARTSI